MNNKEYLQLKFDQIKHMYETNQAEIDRMLLEEGASALVFVYNGKQPAPHPTLKIQEQFMKQMLGLERLIQGQERAIKEANDDEMLKGPDL